ncbi:MAG: sigma-70 family RNA polymerase sigma factor [Hydrogenophilaceae bacterium]|nr:sigma-70 family RNA polymerase sigma factor [Hydrogenophilaceae bacterium]
MSDNAHPLAQALADSRRALLAFLRRQVGDAALAEDLLHEVFVKALTAKQTPANPHGWLRTVTRTTLADYYRARHLAEPLDDEVPAPSESDTRLHEALATCLRPLAEALPPLYRDTLLATEFEGRPLRELAAAEGVSLSAIKSRASRARALLKAQVLACCQVEFDAGLVDDFAQRPGATCHPAGYAPTSENPEAPARTAQGE